MMKRLLVVGISVLTLASMHSWLPAGATRSAELNDIVSSFPWQADIASAPKSKTEQAYTSGMTIQRLRTFFADDTQTEMYNWGAGPRTPANVDMSKRTFAENVGRFGIFVAFEPADVKLYRALLPKNFDMPKEPVVSLVNVDYNQSNPVTRYREGMVMLKAVARDGEETWYVHSMPVEDWLMLMMGHDWGFRKEIFDMKVTREKTTVHRPNGEVFMALELTDEPWGDDSSVIIAEGGAGGINNMAVVYPRNIDMVLRFSNTGNPHPLDQEKRVVKITAGTNLDWAGLVPKSGTAPGMYQRFVYDGGKSHIKKIK